jgi:hypothetical protein
LLLKTLLQAPGRVFSRQQLMDKVWGEDGDSFDRTVDTHIKTLRQAAGGERDAFTHQHPSRYGLQSGALLMRIGMRLLLGYFLIVAIAAWFVLSIFVQEVKPGVRRATEGTLIDTATLLAEVGRDDVLG